MLQTLFQIWKKKKIIFVTSVNSLNFGSALLNVVKNSKSKLSFDFNLNFWRLVLWFWKSLNCAPSYPVSCVRCDLQIFLSPCSVLRITNLIYGICCIWIVVCHIWFVIIFVARKRVSEFSDSFTILKRRLLASSCLSVGPSVRTEQLGFHWTYFHEIWHLSVFRKSAERILVSLEYDKNNGHFTWRTIYIFDHISLSSS